MDYSRFDWEVTDFLKSPAEIVEKTKSEIQSGLGGVCVPPFLVKLIADALRGSGTQTVARLDSAGLAKPVIKAIEVGSCIKDGADRVEVAINSTVLLRRELSAIRQELLEIARAARAARNDVILVARCESMHPQDRETVAEIVQQSAFDEVAADVAAFYAHGEFQPWKVPAGIKVKYKTLGDDAEMLLNTGAGRVGVTMLRVIQ